jgi:DNA repair exonuclease SbcCD ATPase subunit
MIQTMKLKNFQSHKDSELDFSEGINVIVGSSSSGKTAILRGLKWLRTNRPGGGRFVSFWNRDKKGNPIESTSIELMVDDTKLLRWKSEGMNAYGVGETVLSTVGTDVPDQVTQVLKLNDLNVHSQLDPHFLLSESPGKVAEYLNSLVNLSSIDEIMALAQADSRRVAGSLKDTEVAVKDLQASVDKLGWLDNAVELVERIDRQIELAEKYVQVHESLGNLVTDGKALQAVIDTKGEKVAKATELLERIDTVNDNLSSLKLVASSLRSLISSGKPLLKLIALKGVVGEADELIERLSSLDTKLVTMSVTKTSLERLILDGKRLEKAMASKAKVEEANRLLEVAGKDSKDLEAKQASRKALKGLIFDYKMFMDDLKSYQKDLTDNQVQLPAVCPVCGGKLEGKE